MDEVTRAYIAGLVDGEGCISISRDRRGVSYHLRVEISMVNKSVIQFLHNSLGGGFYRHNKARGRQREDWSWRVFGQRAYNVLKLLLPYLRVKKANAMLGIDFRDNWQDQRRQSGYKRGQPHIQYEELKRRQECYIKMKELNSGAFMDRRKHN